MDGYDVEELPTGTAVRVLGRLISAQQKNLDSVREEVSEIKALVKSAIWTGKIVGALIPIIIGATSAAIWAIRNLK